MSSNGAGYDTVDVKACTEAGVLVVNQSGGNRHSVAEHVLAMLLTLSKRIIETDRVMRREDGMNRNTYIGNEAHGKTIGIVGLGNVGSRVAELCRGLFAMPVLAYDPYLSAEEVARRGARKVELDTLMAEADFVSVNCPLTEETRGMIGAKQFARMKPTAFFINTARGFIHDEKALEELLKAKKIAGAGLDVWDKEPPPTNHPLLSTTTCWRARTRPASPGRRAPTWARSPPSSCSRPSTARRRRASSTRRPGRSTRAVSSRSWAAGRRAAGDQVLRGRAVTRARALGEPDAADHQRQGDGVERRERLGDQRHGHHGREHRHQVDEHAGAPRPDQVDAAQVEDLRQERGEDRHPQGHQQARGRRQLEAARVGLEATSGSEVMAAMIASRAKKALPGIAGRSRRATV